MRQLFILGLLLMPAIAYGQASESTVEEDAADRPPSPELPASPLSEKAKEAYGAGRYNEAGRHLFKLALQFPENPAVYRSMARAHSWAGEPIKAIVSYRHYLELAPDASDREKVNAELDLLLRRVKTAPPKELPKAIKDAFDDVEVRAQAGRFTGVDGAFGSLESIHKAKHVSPRLGAARRSLRDALKDHSERALERWWAPGSRAETKTLLELTSGWEKLSESVELNGKEKEWAAAVDGLAHLAAGEPKKAADLLAPVAPGNTRLRYAQVIAMIKIEEYKGAKTILDALIRGQADARVHLLHGFVAQKVKADTATESFMMALDTEDEL